MTLTEFNKLHDLDQVRLISDVGEWLGDRKTGNIRYSLFQVYSFYVEAGMHITNAHHLSLRSFSEKAIPEPYLKEIDISHIFR